MFKYEPVKSRSIKEINGNGQWIFRFDNNYGASVIKGEYSYGGNRGLYELAVIYWLGDEEWHLCYSTEITDDVIGYLEVEEVNELLDRIKALKE